MSAKEQFSTTRNPAFPVSRAVVLVAAFPANLQSTILIVGVLFVLTLTKLVALLTCRQYVKFSLLIAM
jgi:hypothetical protein